MMAGAGVSSGGAGMLRARRRDVSVKPNRKLDRKSSRGMIYENEELRLRTIHINAEVEQVTVLYGNEIGRYVGEWDDELDYASDWVVIFTRLFPTFRSYVVLSKPGSSAERGQSDIKKLRRENEQLRREIWSLRDEYDKLEEILKSQKNREGSEEYEDRSEGEDKDDDEEAEDGSDYSGEEDEEEESDEEEEDGTRDDIAEGEERDQEERLENAENQKISSEKMNNSLHRLHVEFDDLSVVDEEEEVKRDKERKDAVSFEGIDIKKSENDSGLSRIDPGNGYRDFPAQYGSSSEQNYYPNYPFSGDAGFSKLQPMNPSSMLLTPCPTIYDGSIGSVPNFETPGITHVPPRNDENLRNNRMTYGSPVGWQTNIFTPGASFQIPESYHAGVMAAQASGICSASMFTLSGQSDQSAATTTSTVRATSIPRGTSIDERTSTERLISPTASSAKNVPSLLQRRNVLLKQPNSFYGEAIIPSRVALGGIEVPSSAEALTRNGWDFGPSGNITGNREVFRDPNDHKNVNNAQSEKCDSGEIVDERDGLHRQDDLAGTISNGPSIDRPKHFFAPLPAKIQHGRQDSGDKTGKRTTPNLSDSPSMPYFENFGTGRSSSSDRTNSTVISAQHFLHTHLASGTGNFSDGGGKGSADICVNGAVPAYGNDQRDWSTGEHKTYKSSENLLIGDTLHGNNLSRQGSNNPLVKSISCQDLTSEQLQNSLFEISRTFNGDKSQKLTKSDNTLDNPMGGSPKPFKSQLNVTLKFPGRRDSPDTPEIPKLPSINYRLFSNRFLKTFDPNRVNYGNHGVDSPVTRPLSIQVNENTQVKSMLQPAIDYSSAMLTHSFARRLNPEESAGKPTMKTFMNEEESDRHRVLLPSSTSHPIDSRIISSPKLRQEFQVTSFEQPNPRSLPPGLTAFDLDSLRRIPAATSANPIISNHQKLYQNVPFMPGGAAAMFCPPGQSTMRMFFENQTLKVQAQTQTSIDGGSNHEEDAGDAAIKDSKTADSEDPGTPGSPTSMRRKRTIRKVRSNLTTDKRPLSPAAQRRRLRKQSSINTGDGTESNKAGNKSRKFSPTTTTTTTASDHLEDKNESRSSSSGQESPRKDHNRRVSHYFNSKKRPSLTSVKTARSGSIDTNKDGFGTRGGDPLDTTNSERERTNSTSSREPAGGKPRKSSVSSGKVPWCACWGNGCI